jgi:hypothetical protein
MSQHQRQTPVLCNPTFQMLLLLLLLLQLLLLLFQFPAYLPSI